MRVHFIAIGGSAMHNLAIALSRKGINVTGSDDEIFEPSLTRLEKEGILPKVLGWDSNKLSLDIDAVILGMHARIDNPELLKAKELNIPVYSYPEYLYEQSKDKIRIVIGGSHGKTTITSMILHVCKTLNLEIDYMVGAQLDGYDCMVKLTDSAKYMILEGDEYLSSPIDRRPKFHLYKPNVALLSGIAWDHINVFPTFENYVEQFRIFCNLIEPNGSLIYNKTDAIIQELANEQANKKATIKATKQATEQESKITLIPYETPKYENGEDTTTLFWKEKQYELAIFGAHNLQNLMGAMHVCKQMDISNESFLLAMKSFTGAGKRLQKVVEKKNFVMFKDFAHSPSKLKATTSAVKEKYPNRTLIACMELHTFSSLKADFLNQYKDSMNAADRPLVYFSHEVVAHKKLAPITKEEVRAAFGGRVQVVCSKQEVLNFIAENGVQNSALLMMSSGNFDGINFEELGDELLLAIS